MVAGSFSRTVERMKSRSVGRHVEEQLEGLHPCLVDLAPADCFVSIAEVEPDEANELLGIAARQSLLQVCDGHVNR